MLEAFDEDLNRRFAVEPAEVQDLHQCLPKGLDLADVFVWESTRTVHNDWTVRYQNRWYQITGPKHRLPPAKGKVTVRRRRRDQRGARLRTTPGADPSHAERPAWRPDDVPTKAAPPPSPPGSLPGPHTTPKLPRRITPTYQPKGTLLTSSPWGHFYRVLTLKKEEEPALRFPAIMREQIPARQWERFEQFPCGMARVSLVVRSSSRVKMSAFAILVSVSVAVPAASGRV